MLKSISIKNFKNLKIDLELSPGINLIIGPNGKGKTNFIESVFMLSNGYSYRMKNEGNAINWNYKDEITGIRFFKIEGVVETPLGIVNKLEYSVADAANSEGIRKALKVDGVRKSTSSFANYLVTILFSPITLDLITGTPVLRRQDIDQFIVELEEDFFDLKEEYRKVIRNRNKLLVQIQNNPSQTKQLNFWNEKVIELGSEIIFRRKEIINDLNPFIRDAGENLINGDKCALEIEYLSKFLASVNDRKDEIKDNLAQKIEQNLRKEIIIGQSLYGPHREDYSVKLEDKNLRETGSRGQQRMAAFIIKLGEWEFIKRKKSVKSVFLLDDLFSELDKKHRENVANLLGDVDTQIILTALSEDDLHGYLKNGDIRKLEL